MGNILAKDKDSKNGKTYGSLFHTPLHKSNDQTNWTTIIDDSFVVIWCDASIGTNETLSDDQRTLLELARVVNKNRQLIHTFNELDTCVEFIKNVNNVCLIVSGSMGQQIVPIIHNLEQIHSIYVFCWNKPKHDIWASNYNKIRGVYTDIKIICERLKEIIIARQTFDCDLLALDVINGVTASMTDKKSELPLIYAQLTRTILLNVDDVDLAKQDMIDYCRREYTTEYQIRLIDELERDYDRHEPIWWYTRNGFFQRILNRALCKHDLHSLWSMRIFIQNLDNQLAQLPLDEMLGSQSFTLYVGQTIARDDFEKIKSNRGGLVCINQFLSAHIDRAVALTFAEQNFSIITHDFVPILLQIHINPLVTSNVPFANIGAISQFIHEKECLFSMCSVFRIEKIEQSMDPPYIWYVDLSLISINDSQFNQFTQHVQKKFLSEKYDLSELSKILGENLDQFKSAVKLFEHALGRSKHNRLRSIVQHFNMGMFYDALNEPDKAVDEYRHALINTRHFLPDAALHDDICLAPVYSHMGVSYQQQNKFNHAFDHAFRALNIALQARNDIKDKSTIIASCHNNLGFILEQQEQFSQALTFYEQALVLRRECLPIEHPDIVAVQNSIELLRAKQSNAG